jgi:hypothetical protein
LSGAPTMTCDQSRDKSHAVGLLLRPLGGCVHERGHDLTLVTWKRGLTRSDM